ncbi:MAG: glycosyltransferase [Desulfosarcinaceae bacterium]|nr:glycosyltransferase [Desulfosarcinaceae bacterium]
MNSVKRERHTPLSPPPLVSAIIPTHNRAWCLARAVDSVLDQTFTDVELIVVDDGSTDDTAPLLANYGDRLKVIDQPNRGVSAARNTGVRAARGRWIALLDSDDHWLPNKLRTQLDWLDAHPDYRICQTEELWIRDGRRVNPRKRHRKFGGFIFERCLPLCLVSPSAVIIERRLLETVGGFDEALPACEDYDLWLRISCRHPIGLVDQPLLVKTGGHADQLSRTPELDKYRILALAKILRSGVLSPDQSAAALEMLTNKIGVYAGGCRKRGREAQALAYEGLLAALQQTPRQPR